MIYSKQLVLHERNSDIEDKYRVERGLPGTPTSHQVGDLGGPHFCLPNHLGPSLAPGIEAVKPLLRRMAGPLTMPGKDNKSHENNNNSLWAGKQKAALFP